MTNVTASMVKDLRDKTGAGMMDCKAALAETGGDMEAAIDWLRKKGMSKAAKKAGRAAAEGLIGVAVGGDAGALVEVNSETDFVARNDEFKDFVKTRRQARAGRRAISKNCSAATDAAPDVAADADRTRRQDRREHVGAPRHHARGQSGRRRGLCPQRRLAGARQDRRARGAEIDRRQGQAGRTRQAARDACRGRRAARADARASRQGGGRSASAPSRPTSRASPASPRTSSRRCSKAACANSTKSPC